MGHYLPPSPVVFFASSLYSEIKLVVARRGVSFRFGKVGCSWGSFFFRIVDAYTETVFPLLFPLVLLLQQFESPFFTGLPTPDFFFMPNRIGVTHLNFFFAYCLQMACHAAGFFFS